MVASSSASYRKSPTVYQNQKEMECNVGSIWILPTSSWPWADSETLPPSIAKFKASSIKPQIKITAPGPESRKRSQEQGSRGVYHLNSAAEKPSGSVCLPRGWCQTSHLVVSTTTVTSIRPKSTRKTSSWCEKLAMCLFQSPCINRFLCTPVFRDPCWSVHQSFQGLVIPFNPASYPSTG